MVADAIKAWIRSAAVPATAADARAAEVLSELTDLALELARAFQAKALAAVQADDLDRAGQAEAGFNRTALGIRRAIALDANGKLFRKLDGRPPAPAPADTGPPSATAPPVLEPDPEAGRAERRRRESEPNA